MSEPITCEFSLDGKPGSAVLRRGSGIVVTLAGNEVGRVAADELDEILLENDPPDAIAMRLVDYVNMFLGCGLAADDVGAMQAALQEWVGKSR